MPLYDYRCMACGREVEVMHGINDKGPETCQECGGVMRKALSPPAIHFKGSGWAKKDAAAASAKKATPPKSSAASDKGSTNGDAKPGAGESAKTDSGSKSGSGSEASGSATPSAGSKTD